MVDSMWMDYAGTMPAILLSQKHGVPIYMVRPSTIHHIPSPFPYFYQNIPMQTGLNELLTVTFTLFAVIDVLGSIPLLLSLKKKMGGNSGIKSHADIRRADDPVFISGGTIVAECWA